MQRKYIILGLIIFLVLITVITNPNTQAHKEAVKNYVNGVVQKSLKQKNDINIGSLIGGGLIDKIIEMSISSDSYIIFSVTKLNWEGDSKIIGLGFCGNVFLSSNNIRDILSPTFIQQGQEKKAVETQVAKDQVAMDSLEKAIKAQIDAVDDDSLMKVNH